MPNCRIILHERVSKMRTSRDCHSSMFYRPDTIPLRNQQRQSIKKYKQTHKHHYYEEQMKNQLVMCTQLTRHDRKMRVQCLGLSRHCWWPRCSGRQTALESSSVPLPRYSSRSCRHRPPTACPLSSSSPYPPDKHSIEHLHHSQIQQSATHTHTHTPF